jgi:hypothetical protein
MPVSFRESYRTIMLRDDYLHSLWAFANLPPYERHAGAESSAILLQTSPVAGFQYHRGEALWNRLEAGDALALIREPNNSYDAKAVRIEWKGHKLGYLPRVENHAVAQLLDRVEKFSARIVALKSGGDPWKRITLAVELQPLGIQIPRKRHENRLLPRY